jgi:hypothetical protein
MTIERKVGMGIAGQPSGATDVADVFSTYLYTGTGSAQTITNGIDLAGEGGLVWSKNRGLAEDHCLTDTVRGAGNYLLSSATNAQQTDGNIASFNSSGYVFTGNGRGNYNNYNYASWTFRKKSGFFDCVTWSGDNSTNRQISHSLSGPVGMIILKCTSHATNWTVFHTSLGGTKRLVLNRGDISVQTSQEYWNNTNPTSTNFTVGGSGDNNATGRTYVAYLFADNSSEDADDQMIKCGSYTGNGYATHIDINLGWEPQFVLLKNATASGGDLNWQILDTMRGYGVRQSNEYAGTTRLRANTSDAEQNPNSYYGGISSTGFSAYEDNVSYSGDTYIYMAIRAPMMVEPEAATDVFAVKSYTGIGGNRTLDAAFGPVDMAIAKRLADSSAAINLTTRSTSKEFSTNVSDPEGSFNFVNLESNSLVVPGSYFSNASGIPYGLWAWKRAKGFFDVVAYAGTDTYRWQSHSLGAVPEMIWVKGRTADVSWAVYHKDVGSSKYLMLNDDAGQISSSSRWGGSDPTDSLFRLGSSSMVNAASDTYVAYLFTTLDGISKCGSYVGNGTNQTIDCGFSAGARLILIKPSSTSGAWYLWDSARGIVAGGDPHLMLHSTAGQITGDDSVDPHNSGFKVNQIANTGINVSSTTYIFYAIA